MRRLKRKKTVANWLFAQTTHVAVSKSKFAYRMGSVCSSIYQVLFKLVQWFCRCGWSKIALSHYFDNYWLSRLYAASPREFAAWPAASPRLCRDIVCHTVAGTHAGTYVPRLILGYNSLYCRIQAVIWLVSFRNDMSVSSLTTGFVFVY